MTGAWPYRAVAISIYIYNTRHRLIRWLLSSRFDDISLLSLFYFLIESTLASSTVSTLARKSIKPD